MLPRMGENENEETEGNKRPISRRAFLAGGAALGGVVVWGAAASPAGAAGTLPGSPPIMNSQPVPPIFKTGPAPTTTVTFTAGAKTGPTTTAAPGGTSSKGDVDPDDHDHSGRSGDNNNLFDFVQPPFRFRFQGLNDPF
jgi:hypothetical protein